MKIIQQQRHYRAWLKAKDNGLSLFEIHNEDEPRFLMTYSCMPKEVGSIKDNATIEEIEEVLNKIDRS